MEPNKEIKSNKVSETYNVTDSVYAIEVEVGPNAKSDTVTTYPNQQLLDALNGKQITVADLRQIATLINKAADVAEKKK